MKSSRLCGETWSRVSAGFSSPTTISRGTPTGKPIFDRLIEMREKEKLNIKFMIQVDTMCHRLPHFIEKAGRAGVRRVFIGLESINPAEPAGRARKSKTRSPSTARCCWNGSGRARSCSPDTFVGFPEDTPESVLHDIEIIQRELPIDLLEPHCLTALPGSEDHQKLYQGGRVSGSGPEQIRFGARDHDAREDVRAEQWENLYRDAWKEFYRSSTWRRCCAARLRRESAPANMTVLLLWFHFCVVTEKIDPLQGGYLRRKYRKDRRPTMPIESPLVFYPRFIGGLIRKHVRMAQLAWRFHSFRKGLERDAAARTYTDAALKMDFEHDPESMEMLAAHTEQKAATA